MTIPSLFAAACPSPSFFGFPTWYEYLPTAPGTCSPQLGHLNDIWLIVLAVTDILLRLAAIIAIIFVIYGGIQFILSQGNPDQAKRAQTTILNALVGLVIAVGASAIISFIAGQFH